MPEVFPGLIIPEEEVRFSASRSGGPGGQNVNKVNSRVTLIFDVEGSAALTPEMKERIKGYLSGRVSRAGILRVVSQQHRSQAANREAALARFVRLLAEALAESPARLATRPTRAARIRRLEAKRRRSGLKTSRGRVALPND